MTARTRASAIIPANADEVFGAVIDIAGLPRWNRAMTTVVEQTRPFEVGAEWVVEFRVLGQTWRSRSTVETLDTPGRRFVYRSGSDDGNPSYARWAWDVAADGAGSRVTVTWSLHPATFWRRVLLARVRGRQLGRSEVPESLAALAGVLSRQPSDVPTGDA